MDITWVVEFNRTKPGVRSWSSRSAQSTQLLWRYSPKAGEVTRSSKAEIAHRESAPEHFVCNIDDNPSISYRLSPRLYNAVPRVSCNSIAQTSQMSFRGPVSCLALVFPERRLTDFLDAPC
jgi:hypothetical protein